MAGSASNSDDEITGINVTPLVDIMLVLLIVFMVTANLINSKAIGVNLPAAATGSDVEAETIKLEIAKSGALTLEERKIRLDQLGTSVLALRHGKKPQNVSIAADRAAPHGAVIDAIDVLRKSGIYDFAFAVAPE